MGRRITNHERTIENTTWLDRLVALMANRRIRQVIQYLLDQGPTQVELNTLVDVLIRTDATVGGDGREEIAVDLHHRLLPQLSTAGIIDYDTQSSTVDYRPTPRETRVLRALVTTTRWSENAAR